MANRHDKQWNLTNTSAGRWEPTRRSAPVPISTHTTADHVPHAVLTPEELRVFMLASRSERWAIICGLIKTSPDGHIEKRLRYLQIMNASRGRDA